MSEKEQLKKWYPNLVAYNDDANYITFVQKGFDEKSGIGVMHTLINIISTSIALDTKNEMEAINYVENFLIATKQLAGHATEVGAEKALESANIPFPNSCLNPKDIAKMIMVITKYAAENPSEWFHYLD